MRLHYKTLVAGIILAVLASFASVFAAGDKLNVPNTASIKTWPYFVEVLDAKGNKAGEFHGVSDKISLLPIATELGAAPYVEDRLSAFPDPRLGIGSKITLNRAPDITIIDGKKTSVVRSWQTTVGELFTEKDIELLGDDRVNFALNTAVETGMEIKITRVAIVDLVKTEGIDYKTIRKNDNTLDKGKTRVQTVGIKGERALTYQIRREDGVEIARKLTKTEVTKSPTDEILIIGTKPVITGWCRYNDLVLDASIKNGLDPDRLCKLMNIESMGRASVVGTHNGINYYGLFQYTEGFWSDASKRAGYTGADILDARAQIYTTAWALMHGYSGRW